MKRRTFFGLVGLAAGTSLVARAQKASAAAVVRPDGMGMLIDLTACVGCRSCEAACAEANGLPAPEEPDAASTARRTTSERQWVVVNKNETPNGEVFARQQCMHCVEPACTSACLTKALYKTDEGPVIWRADKCMGCRFCMISCPFDVPKFEYHSANPRIQKCQMCWSRQTKGQKPACVEACPAEAVITGKRSELLEIARKRIYTNPGKYVSHIYGEREAGGTNVLYISGVPFEKLGFQMGLDETAYPEHTKNFLTAVPVVLTLWPAFLLALRSSTAPPVTTNAAAEPGAKEEV